ncbi:MAG: polyprenyl synthetase family protein [Sedimentisphaerales bacterium]
MQSSARMGGAAVSVSGAANRLLPTFSIIANELEGVRALIERETSDCSEPVRGLVAQSIAGGGKMVRPGLVLLSGLVCGRVTEKHIRAAAIMEMIHNATLLHDDVVDEGKSRRGVPTLNSLRGNESAVLLGDFLLSRVFRLCVGLDRRTVEIIASAVVRTCEGELRQVAQRGDREISESEYIEIIDEKSAALFSGACAAGAILAGAGEPEVRMLADYGRNAGIAFQIADDVLDLVGDQDKTGKAVGNDVDNSKLTLPIIHLLKTAGEADREVVRRILAAQGENKRERRHRELTEKLGSCGSIGYAQRRAHEFSEQAIAAIKGFNESEGKNALIGLSRFASQRAV